MEWGGRKEGEITRDAFCLSVCGCVSHALSPSLFGTTAELLLFIGVGI